MLLFQNPMLVFLVFFTLKILETLKKHPEHISFHISDLKYVCVFVQRERCPSVLNLTLPHWRHSNKKQWKWRLTLQSPDLRSHWANNAARAGFYGLCLQVVFACGLASKLPLFVWEHMSFKREHSKSLYQHTHVQIFLLERTLKSMEDTGGM